MKITSREEIIVMSGGDHDVDISISWSARHSLGLMSKMEGEGVKGGK
jgi:hypothetical protein